MIDRPESACTGGACVASTESMPSSPNQLPGKGLFGWFGRQIGYVSRAVKQDVTDQSKKVYEQRNVDEQPHPTDPNVTLRRTTIDEAIRKSPGPG
jgi:hypothetical protein